jgi:hypothetical protein
LRHPVQEDLEWRAEQDHLVEEVVQRTLVRHAPGDEQPPRAVSRQKRPHAPEVPQGLTPACAVVIDDPAGVVGVKNAVTAAAQLAEHRRLPGPGHPGQEHHRPLHDGILHDEPSATVQAVTQS